MDYCYGMATNRSCETNSFQKIEKVIRFPQSEILEAKDLVITDFLINRNFEITIF